MTVTWYNLLISCFYGPRILPYLLALARLVVCFLPQVGYLHPDEFFQSPDIVAGQRYQSKIEKSWEFTTDKPIRCMLVPVLLNKLAFLLVDKFSPNPSAYLLIVVPRLIYTITSFSIDWCLYKLCQYYSSQGLWYLPVSIIFQSSFICLGCATRTLGNVIETVIFSFLLVAVCRLIKPRFRIVFVTPTRSRPTYELVKMSIQLGSSAAVGFLLALGTFNRPTFPCFAFVPMLYWTFESFKRNSYNVHLNLYRVLLPSALTFVITGVLLSAFDTFYYSIEENPWEIFHRILHLITRFEFDQLNEHIATHWVLTPYNFIKYNSNTDNLANHTLHAPYVHILINIPLAFNVLGIMFYCKLLNLALGPGVHRLVFGTHRIGALMILTALTSTFLLSLIPHQEFRFLLPVIVPLVYAFGFDIYASKLWLSLWLLLNLTLTYFYSFVHQAGVIKAALDLDPILKSHHAATGEDRHLIDVLAFRCYLVPTYQWNIPQSDEHIRFDLHHTHDEFLDSLNDKLNLVMQRHQEFGMSEHLKHSIYVMLPNLYVTQLQQYISHYVHGNLTNIGLIKSYAAHFSGEDFSNSLAHMREFGLSSWRDAFGFSLLKMSAYLPSDSELDNNHII